MNKIKRINNLISELNQHKHYYYNLSKHEISDAEYDKLIDELHKLESETGIILTNSPTQTVGYEVVSKLQKRNHPTPLKSLRKTKSISELNQWKDNKDILLMAKADGLTIELVYEEGKLKGGYTRGDGETGEDVTSNVKTFKNIPLTIPFKNKLRIVGEAIIHKNDFEVINSKLHEKDKYATPRNLCSGSVRQLNSRICAERNVYFYVFDILEHNNTFSFNSKYKNLMWLSELGYWTMVNILVRENEEINLEKINLIKETANNMNIPIDGYVATFDSIEYSKSLGETSHSPHYSRAYKEDDLKIETVLIDIEWNTTRTGHINPVAIFNTVILDNTKVNRASLHNLSIIKSLNLNIGDRILVSKRNQIIPYIEENLDKDNGKTMNFPNKCYSCNGKTEIKNTGSADFLVCNNKQCPAQLLDKFMNFVKRDAMNIEGLSEATLKKFIEKGFIRTFDDIYNLEQYKNDIINMEGFGLKSYNRLIDSINKSKKVKLNKFIVALGISEVGRSASKIITKHFNNDWFEFESALANNFNFTQLKDFGEIMNNNLHNWYKDNEEGKLWKGLISILEFEKEGDEAKMEIKGINGVFEGKKIYCTGQFESYKKNDLKEIVERNGGKFASGYAKSLDMLVEGKLKSSTKVQKAFKDGVCVISEDEFLEMVGS